LGGDGHQLNSEHKKRIYAFTQVLNARFARDAGMQLPDVPGFYIMSDYQSLMRGVDNEEPEARDLSVQGAIPKALEGCYFVTGPGVLRQDGAHVHPFDGHGLVRRFQIDGQQGRVLYQSSFVRTPAFIDEAAHAQPGASKAASNLTPALISALLPTAGLVLTETFKERLRGTLRKHDRLARWARLRLAKICVGEMPVLKRGIGTNTQIWRNFLRISGLIPDRNPSNTCIIPVDSGRKLLSAYEGGLPFLMAGNTLETLGEVDFEGALDGFFFLAHTRHDSDR